MWAGGDIEPHKCYGDRKGEKIHDSSQPADVGEANDEIEHTGHFGGAKRYFQGPGAPTNVAGVMIGYPGLDTLIVGGRGVFRARLRVHGISSHSGGNQATPNAIEKTAQLVNAVTATPLPDRMIEDFPLPAKLTITTIHGGEGYSLTPDLCTLGIDMRTTPAVDHRTFRELLYHAITGVDQTWPDTRATIMDLDTIPTVKPPTTRQSSTCWGTDMGDCSLNGIIGECGT